MSLIADIVDRVLFPNREIHAIPALDGAFSPNQRLDKARKIGDDIDRPDDLALGPDGALYLSTDTVVLRCAPPDFTTRREFARLSAPVGSLAWTPGGDLIACVSRYGLVALSQAGEVIARLERAGGEPIVCPTAVTVAEDGTVYATDGSRHYPPEAWLHDLMAGHAPSGRLISWNQDFTNATVLATHLSWPNGIVVSHNNDDVLVSESWVHRLTAFSRTGSGRRILAKNFAGYPARINRGQLKDYWITFFALRTHLTEFVLRERNFREAMIKTVPQELWIGPTLGDHFDHREPTQIGRIKKLGIQKPWAPARSYGLIARLDNRGEALESLHSRVDGLIHGVTAAGPVGARVLAISKGRNCLVELPAPSADARQS